MFGYLWVMESHHPISTLTFVAIVVLFFSILPLFILLSFKKLNMVESIEVTHRENRPLPFLFGIFSYLGGCVLLGYLLQWQGIIVAALAALLLGSLITGLITLKWKVSIHCTGASIAAMFLFMSPFVMETVWFSLFHVITPVFLASSMIWSRVRLKAHTLSQATVGTLIGVLTSLLCIYLISV